MKALSKLFTPARLLLFAASIAVTLGILFLYQGTLPAGATADQVYFSLGEERRASIALPEIREFQARPLESRIYGTSDEVLKLIEAQGLLSGARGQQPMALMFEQAPTHLQTLLGALPAPVRAVLERRLVGIFIGALLPTPASVHLLFSTLETAEPLGAILVLDWAAYMKEKGQEPRLLGELVSRQELARFDDGGKLQIDAKVEHKPGQLPPMHLDLLRELGRVYSLEVPAHPSWDYLIWHDQEPTEAYPFLALSWELGPRSFAIRSELDFPGRSQLADRTQRPKRSLLPELYGQLSKSSFPTLAASLSPFEDFAESFATYLHTVHFGQPYELSVKRGAKTVRTLTTCWTEDRCKQKRAVLETLLQL